MAEHMIRTISHFLIPSNILTNPTLKHQMLRLTQTGLRLVVDCLGSAQIALVLEILDDDLDGIFHTGLVTVDVDLRLQGFLIGGADTGELGDLALTSLLVQTLWIALLGDLNGNIDPDFDKGNASFTAWPLGLVQLTGQVTVTSVGADEAGDGDGGGVGEQLGHLGDAADVFFAVLGRETEVFVQTEADVVTIEAVGGLVVGLAQQGLF